MNEHKSFQVEEVEGGAPPPRARVEDVAAPAESSAEKLGRVVRGMFNPPGGSPLDKY